MVLIITGIGYEGSAKLFAIKGKDTKECLMKASMKIGKVDIDEVDGMDEDELIDYIENGAQDPSDWVLCSIYDATNNRVVHESEGEVIIVK